MKDWKEKYLSQAGREVLIKSVIQAIPSYSMNGFLLPITTCQEIERATARFFWGSTLEDRKCHWAGWDILTTAKANRSIGFRELHYCNLAMLAKQLWILSQHPESLAFRLLKAKYFPRQQLLQAPVGYRPSYLWRSLHSARNLVMEGQAWRIRDGNLAPIKERWIGATNQTTPMEIRNPELLGNTVNALIDNHNMTWRTDILVNHFTIKEVKRISEIPLSLRREADRRIWRFTPHRFFSVKTAYHLAVSLYSRLHDSRASTSVTPTEWKKLWLIDVPPRVRMFMWRACMDALPTKMNLKRRGCDIDPICTLCGEGAESTTHFSLGCRRSKLCWYTSMLRIDNKEKAASFQEFAWRKLMKSPTEIAELMAYTTWEIWHARCKACMEGKPFLEKEVVNNAQMQWENFRVERERENHSGGDENREKEGQWKKPTINTFKLNCDVAVLGEGRVGLGFVIRDGQAKVVLAGKKEETATGSSTGRIRNAVCYANG